MLKHSVAARAVLELHRRGEVLHIAPQILIEFRNVATRPVAVNGMGLSAVDAETQATVFETSFPLLPETRTFTRPGKLWSAGWTSSVNRSMMPAWRPSATSTPCRIY